MPTSPEICMFGNNLLLPSRQAARPRRPVQNGQISSDTPYSPVIQYSPTQKIPHPHIRGHYAKERVIPARLDRKFFSRSGGRVSNALPRYLWDRVIFACFCGCVLLLSYSLAGLGYAGHDYATCSSFNNHSYTTTRALHAVTTTPTNARKAPKAERGLGEERLEWKIDPTSSLGYRYPLKVSSLTDAAGKMIPTLFPTLTTAMDHPQEMYESSTTGVASLTYIVSTDHAKRLISGHEHGNDGSLFAHRIHNQPDGSFQ